MVESQPSKLLVAGSIPVSRSRIFGSGAMTVGFEQAAIKIEKAQEFGELQAGVELAFLPEKVERFLKQLDRKGIRIRDFDGVLTKKVLEAAAGSSCLNAQQLYQSLTLSDQAQMREFYLSKLEGVDSALRHKFKKLYQYY